MKTAKILSDVCGAFCTGNRLLIGDYDDRIGVSTDGYCVYLLDPKDFPFDRAALLKGRELVNYKQCFPKETTEAIVTNEMVKRDKYTAQRLTDGKIDVWIDTRLLKHFDKVVTFRVSTPKSGVLVYENETLAGMIMPVNIKKGE